MLQISYTDLRTAELPILILVVLFPGRKNRPFPDGLTKMRQLWVRQKKHSGRMPFGKGMFTYYVRKWQFWPLPTPSETKNCIAKVRNIPLLNFWLKPPSCLRRKQCSRNKWTFPNQVEVLTCIRSGPVHGNSPQNWTKASIKEFYVTTLPFICQKLHLFHSLVPEEIVQRGTDLGPIEMYGAVMSALFTWVC